MTRSVIHVDFKMNSGLLETHRSCLTFIHQITCHQMQFSFFPSGREFITALGEIYRAVMILEAAVKFYKPWILLSGADLNGIFGLLEECHSLWSTSRLEESIPADYVLESIRHIQNLDEVAIADEVLCQDVFQCGLSLLSPGVVPGVLTYTSTS